VSIYARNVLYVSAYSSIIYIQNLVLYLHISLAGHQKCSTWYLYFYLYLYLYLNIHFWKFVKAKTEQVLISLGDLCQIDCNLSLCCLFCLMECPDMLATCKLSVKQTISESNDRWQPNRKSHLYQFLFSYCQLDLASKSW